MALNFTTTKKASLNHGVKCLVYGEAGVGKTMLCGTCPGPLIISAEQGLLTLRNKDVPAIVVSSYAEVLEAFEWCRTTAASKGIQTVCLDSISEIAEKCLVTEKAKTKDPRAAYGEMATSVIDLVKKFRDLPGFHVLVTAKQTLSEDSVSGVVKAVPTAPGRQVAEQLPYLFDEVFHAYAGKDPATQVPFYALRTRASFNAVAKDRSGSLDEIEYPDISNIIGKIQKPRT